MDQHESVIVITGGSSGVGLATACRFASSGYRIVVCGRDQNRLESAREAIAASLDDASDVEVIQADIAQKSGASQLISHAKQQFGRVDILLNNAAVVPLSPLDETSDDSFEGCIDLNIKGVFYATRAAWTIMKEQGSGIIVNISSQAAVDPFPGFSVYGSSKAWIELFTVALAREGKSHGIRAYGLRPGAIETPMLRGLFPDFPVEQTVSPDDVAEVVYTVCQPGFANSSGQIVSVTRQ